MDKTALRRSIEKSITFGYARSGGPGGQNVNKVNSKVTANMNLEDLEGLTEKEMIQMRERLAGRINGRGELVLQAEEDRSQARNRAIAMERLYSLVCEAGRLPKKRRPTRPGRAARENRLSAKRKQKEKKALRKSVGRDNGD